MTMGTMTFGGVGWAKITGEIGVAEANRLVDLCLDAGKDFVGIAETAKLNPDMLVPHTSSRLDYDSLFQVLPID